MDRRFSITLCVLLIGCGPPPTSPPDPYAEIISEPVTVEELSAVLATGDVDAVVYGLNEVKKTMLNYDLIDVVACQRVSATITGHCRMLWIALYIVASRLWDWIDTARDDC